MILAVTRPVCWWTGVYVSLALEIGTRVARWTILNHAKPRSGRTEAWGPNV